MHNHYWDLNECRWVHYVHADHNEVAAEAVAVPTQRTDETAPDVVPELAGAVSVP